MDPPRLFLVPPLFSVKLEAGEVVFIQHIIVALFNKTVLEGNVKLKAPKPSNWTRNERSPFFDQLFKIVLNSIPSFVKDIHKFGDLELQGKCDAFLHKVSGIKNEYESMAGRLKVPEVAVLHTINSPNDTHRILLTTLAGEYATLKDKVKQEIEGELKELKACVKERIAWFEETDTSDTSLQLLVNLYDIDESYLKENINDFKERTGMFQKTLDELSKVLAQIDFSRKQFKLVYLPIYNIVKQFFLMNASAMPSAVSSYRPTPQQLPPPVSLPKEFTDDQKQMIVQLFEFIMRKMQILSHHIEVMPSRQDPLFFPIFKLISAWTPLNNTIKSSEDSALQNKVEACLDCIKKVNDMLNSFTLKYKKHITTLSSDYAAGKFPPDERATDLQFYTGNSFCDLSEKWEDLSKKLSQRVVMGKKRSISAASKLVLCKCFDISPFKFEKNLQDYSQFTDFFQTMKEDIDNELGKLNKEIENFSYEINYYTYLTLSFSVDTYANQFNFMTSKEDWLKSGAFPTLPVIPDHVQKKYKNTNN